MGYGLPFRNSRHATASRATWARPQSGAIALGQTPYTAYTRAWDSFKNRIFGCRNIRMYSNIRKLFEYSNVSATKYSNNLRILCTNYCVISHVICKFDHVHDGRCLIGCSVARHVAAYRGMLRHDAACCDENDATYRAAQYVRRRARIRCERRISTRQN